MNFLFWPRSTFLLKPIFSGLPLSIFFLFFLLFFLISANLLAQAAEVESYGALLTAYEQKHYGAVVEDGTKLLALLPKGDVAAAPTRVLVSLASLKTQSLLASVGPFRQAFEDYPAAVTATNYGAVEMLVGDKQLARSLFEKALAFAPDDFCAHLGLAEIFALDPKLGLTAANAELGRACAYLSDIAKSIDLQDCEKLAAQWSILADHYLLLKEPAAALSAYLKAEQNLSESAAKSCIAGSALRTHLNQSILRAALLKGDERLAKERLAAALATPNLPLEVYTLSATRLSSVGAGGGGLAKRLYEKALSENDSDNDLFYALGRAFGDAGDDAYALRCLGRAHEKEPEDSKFALAFAAQLARGGEKAAAARQLTAIVARARSQEPTPQRKMAQALAGAGLSLLPQYQKDWALTLKASLGGQSLPIFKTAYAGLFSIKCHCRLLTMQYTLHSQPGVVFSFIPDDKEPVAFIIYDSKTTSPGQVWQSLHDEAKAAPLVRSENLSDFYTLVKTALDYAEAPYRPEHPYYVFNTLPLRTLSLPKRG